MINHWELEIQPTVSEATFCCNGEERYVKGISFVQVRGSCYWVAILPYYPRRPWAFYGTGTCTEWGEGTFFAIVENGVANETALPMVQIGDRITITGLLEFDGEITAPLTNEQQLRIRERIGAEDKEE